MWSDAARTASLQVRGGSSGGSAALNGVAAPVGQGSAQSGALQAGLAQAGAGSRGRWGAQTVGGGGRGGGGSLGGGGGSGQGTHTNVTITGDKGVAAHQTGVNGVQRNMTKAGRGAPLTTLPPAYYPNVANSSYGYGKSGMPGL